MKIILKDFEHNSYHYNRYECTLHDVTELNDETKDEIVKGIIENLDMIENK